MPHALRVSPKPRRSIAPAAEPLERRTLLSGSPPGKETIAIQVPSAYISQHASQLDVTLVRTTAAGHARATRPITINFNAGSGLLPGGAQPGPSVAGQYFTPVNESVTFPAGVTTLAVAVPINSGAANAGLVPIELDVTSSAHQVKGSSTTVYLANSAAAVPPSIIGVQRVAGGIAVKFSKPMAPASVENIHNYAVKFSPTQKYSLENLNGVGLIETLTQMKQPIPLRRATYDPATDTVLLVAQEELGSAGSYQIMSPVSLLMKRGGPRKAQPLTDIEGNGLDQGGNVVGEFSITISKGKPYSAAQPVLSDGT